MRQATWACQALGTLFSARVSNESRASTAGLLLSQ